MEPVKIVMEWVKETKNTNVYGSIPEGAVIPTLYISKEIPRMELIELTVIGHIINKEETT